MHCLDPNIVTGPWTEEEDRALLSAVAPDASSELKFNEWGKLAQLTPGRTPKSAMRRLKSLLQSRERERAGLPPKKMQPAVKASEKKRKEAEKRKAAEEVPPLTMTTRRGAAEKNVSQEVMDLTERPQKNKRARILAPAPTASPTK